MTFSKERMLVILILLTAQESNAKLDILDSEAILVSWDRNETKNQIPSAISSDGTTENQELIPELIFTHVLWRHGDRSPLSIYPKDPYQISTWPNGLGELTEIGMRQQFKIGQRLYTQYVNCTPPFLSKNYDHQEIYVRSTDVNRTLVSAMAVLAGMFPDGIAGKDYPRESDEPKWPRNWIPIPVHTSDLKYDYTGSPFRRCARAQLLEREALLSKDFNDTIGKYQDLLEYLSDMTGYKMLQPDEHFYFLYDTLTVEGAHNLTRPEWYTKKIEEEMRALSAEVWKYRYGNAKYFGENNELIRLRGGAVLGGVIDHIRRKWECMISDDAGCFWFKNLKFYGLSTHDVTISSLLIALEINDSLIKNSNPHYGATATFELYRKSNESYVKFLYSNIHSEKPQPVTHLIAGCPSTNDLCPLENFVARSMHILPVNIEHECNKDAQKRLRRIRAVENMEKPVDDVQLGGYFDGYTYNFLS